MTRTNFEGLRAAISFLTPLGTGAHTPAPGALRWFPVVGAGIGATTGWGWRAMTAHGLATSAAAATVAADCALTGALHLDGLADSADGLLAHAPAKQRLAIMAEPQLGTFAATALGLVLVAKTAALSDIAPSPLLLASLGCASRSLMVLGAQLLPYARAQGLASAFLDERPSRSWAFTTGIAISGLGAAALGSARAKSIGGVAGLVAGTMAGAGVLALARRRLGGFTGDVLGAAGVVCETTGLLATALIGRELRQSR
ncbi:MAG TPA: adenosylcobinamide-GDP ribazoletransferase [Acidimicrobiales bacterium]|nr:adenosylcobinamide-GDP ribazoletransferase [Acidimicrobiales bacterium]